MIASVKEAAKYNEDAKNKFDHVNLKNIHKKFGTLKLKHFPNYGLYQRFFYEEVLGIEMVHLLNLIPYVKNEAKELLKEINTVEHFLDTQFDQKTKDRRQNPLVLKLRVSR
jgi:hypothetical protein